MIRSTKHYLDVCNKGKKEIISSFLAEYRIAVQSYIDYIWSNEFLDSNLNVIFNIKKDKLFLPKYLSYKLIKNDNLSARALTSAIAQAIGIVRGTITIRRKTLYAIQKRIEEGKSTDYLKSKLDKLSLTKPIVKLNLPAELSQLHIEVKNTSGFFNLFIKLYCTGFAKIKIPIKLHKQDKKWASSSGKRLNSVLLSENCIQLRYDIEDPPKKLGKTVGADSGLKTVLTLSDGQVTPNKDNHGHSLESICKKITRKRKGSKAFSKAAAHRLNFVNWSINQLNFKDVGQVNLEQIFDIKRGNKTSKILNAFCNPLIQNKVSRKLEEAGVQLNLQPSMYRSQRCSRCCIVRKLNRKGKLYSCNNCHLEIDADLNAALNHEVQLPLISFNYRQHLSALPFFFWKKNGIFDNVGQEFIVPDAKDK